MKLSAIRRYRKKHKIYNALLTRNPVLVLGLDLPFVIACATSLKNAVAMSIEMFMIHVVVMMVAMAVCRRLPLWQRAIVNVCVATVMMMAAQVVILALFKGISNSLGMYLYLMPVNGMTMLLANNISRRAKAWPVLTDALLDALGFSLVAVVAAVLRELLGNGTLWGVPVNVPIKMSGLLIPFAGFLVMGFLLAFTRFVNKRMLALMMRDAARKSAHYTKIHIDSVETID